MTQSGQDGSDVVFVGEKSRYFRSAITHHWSLDDLSINVVRDLGVQFRADLLVTDQVSKVVRSCYYNIRQLRTILLSLTPDALRDAAYALILSPAGLL